MRIETILNHLEPHKGFVYKGSELNRDTDTLEDTIAERHKEPCMKRSTGLILSGLPLFPLGRLLASEGDEVKKRLLMRKSFGQGVMRFDVLKGAARAV